LPRSKTASLATRKNKVRLNEVFTFLKADTNLKFILDLRTATVRQGKRKNGESFISITNRTNETVMITFDEKVKFEKWALVFAESCLQDDQLFQKQIVPKLQEDERKLKQE